MTDMLNRGEKLPVDFTNRFIYYVGPVDPVREEVMGPAGPTTATRMDKFTRQMLEQTGLLGMVGKSERGPTAIEAIRDHKAVYLMAVGGAAYLVSKAIKKSRVLGFADLGMEAIYEFEVEDMPVTVAVDVERQLGARVRSERVAGEDRGVGGDHRVISRPKASVKMTECPILPPAVGDTVGLERTTHLSRLRYHHLCWRQRLCPMPIHSHRKRFPRHQGNPGHVYYGIQTARAVENYPISGLRAHPALIRAIAMVKEAAAEANRELGLVDEKTADAIIERRQEVQTGQVGRALCGGRFPGGRRRQLPHEHQRGHRQSRLRDCWAASWASTNTSHPNDHVNYGQSTNDVFPTAMRLATLLELESCILCSTADRRAGQKRQRVPSHPEVGPHPHDGRRAHAPGPGISRPTRAQSSGRRSRFVSKVGILREVGLGGSAVGTGINTHPDYREKADRQSRAHLRQKLTPWTTCAMPCSRTWRCRQSARRCAIWRWRSFASPTICGCFRQARTPVSRRSTLPALQPGSSIMPGKINPVMAELAAMVSFQVVGYDTAVALAVQAGQLELNVMMPTMAYSVLTSITIMTNMLRQLTDFCIKGITANEQRCRVLRAKHGIAGYRAQSLYRVRQGGGDREGIGRDRQDDHRDRPRKEAT